MFLSPPPCRSPLGAATIVLAKGEGIPLEGTTSAYRYAGDQERPCASAKPMRDRSRMTELAFQDEPPTGSVVTAYDEGHLVTYLRILDATAEQADWREVVLLVFGLDAEREPERAKRIYDSHLARARWMTECGYRDLVAKGRS